MGALIKHLVTSDDFFAEINNQDTALQFNVN